MIQYKGLKITICMLMGIACICLLLFQCEFMHLHNVFFCSRFIYIKLPQDFSVCICFNCMWLENYMRHNLFRMLSILLSWIWEVDIIILGLLKETHGRQLSKQSKVCMNGWLCHLGFVMLVLHSWDLWMMF